MPSLIVKGKFSSRYSRAEELSVGRPYCRVELRVGGLFAIEGKKKKKKERHPRA